MFSSDQLAEMFFHDLKQYNTTNFKTIANADLSISNPIIYKSFSSVVTRYFIFQEHHPEISDMEHRILYFKLKIDMISRYFSQYPSDSIEDLRPFQIELLNYVKLHESIKTGDMNV